MTPGADRFARLRALFDQAVDLDPADRPAFLDRACAGDATLRQEVEDLLAALGAGAAALEPVPPATWRPAPRPRDDGAAMAGRQVGVYQVVRLIGYGGMGAVYEAVRADDQFRKRVAIKLIKRGMDSDLAIRRFRHERQILANLDHRNIAGLLDGGVAEDGRPYFVMEYVEGEPITRHCDRHRLGVEARLRLFRQVCGAVQHAHRSLVVHRDLKPGNILVSTDGTVKLLDFGIAKLLGEEEDPGSPPLTRGGFRALTPEYASPEMIRGEAITTAADVYGLGVVLFELLAGRRPFRFDDQTLQGIERTICEEPPPRLPAAATAQAAALAGERSLAAYRRRLAGELDHIVAMALRKEPERRYPSVEALAQDLQRHLEGRPVVAHRDWAGYRLRKFAGRNLAGVAAAGLVAASLVGGVVATMRQAARAERERARAVQVAGFVTAMLSAPQPEAQGRDVTVAEVLHRAAERAQAELRRQPDLLAEIESTVGLSYLGLGRHPEAEEHLSAALALRRQVHGPRSRAAAIGLQHLGSVAWSRGDWPRADSLYAEALAAYRPRGGGADSVLASLLGSAGAVRRALGDLATAERHLRESLAVRRRLHRGDHVDVATAANDLAVLFGDLGRWAEAEPLHREAVAMAVRLFGPDHPTTASALNALATALDLQKKHADADSAYTATLAIRARHLGTDHPDYTRTAMNYAAFLNDVGRHAQAAGVARGILAHRGGTLAETHPAVAVSLQTLGVSLSHQGDAAGAEQALRESLELRRRTLPPGHWLLASSEGVLGEHFLRAGQLARADTLLRHSHRLFTTALGPGHERTLQAADRLRRLDSARAATGGAPAPVTASAVP
jgi:eukaryotic-like serine/threonine-protein kinase